MKPDGQSLKESCPGMAEAAPSFKRLGLAALVFVIIPVIVLVPLAIFPSGTSYLDSLSTFYLPKFLLLVTFLVPLFAAVLGAALWDGRPLRVPVLIPALAFLSVSALSTILAEDMWRALIGDRFNGLITLSAGVLLFYATARLLDSWARVRICLVAVVATACFTSIYGVLQSFELDPLLELEMRWPKGGRGIFSTLSGPNHLAAYLTLTMGATLALYFLTGRRRARMLYLLALALLSACWLYTYTRGAVLGVGTALPVLLWLAHRRMGSVRPMLLPLAVLAVTIFAAQLLSPRPVDILHGLLGATHAQSSPAKLSQASDERDGSTTRASSLLPSFQFTNVAKHTAGVRQAQVPSDNQVSSTEQAPPKPEQGVNDSFRVRLLILRDTIPTILDHPLLGHGPDNFSEPFSKHMGEDLRAALPVRQYVDAAHNELLQVAATTGLLGLAAYLWVLIAYFRSAYRSGGWVLLALSGGVLAYVLQLQALFTTIAGGITFWAILGVSVAVMRLQERSQPESTSPDIRWSLRR